jgi:hypothetical protein
MAKIYLISNSQGSSQGIEPGQNYPCLLQKMMPETQFHYWVISGGSVRDFNTHIENILMVQPDLVEFQIGIVECAQRILSNKEKEIFRVLPFGKFATKKLHEHRKHVIRIRRKLRISTRSIAPDQFKAELQIITRKLENAGIRYIFLEIPNFSSEFEAQYYPHINSDIDLYNTLLRGFRTIPLLTPSDDLYSIWQAGSVHFTTKGHQHIAKKLKTIMEQQLNSSATWVK